MAQKKYSSSRQSSETIKPNTKLVLVSREPLLYLEFNKPNKQNVYGHLINSAFLSLKIIVDTLTDVGNAKHQEQQRLKSDEINT